MRALLSEFQLGQRWRPSILLLVQSAINSLPHPCLVNHCFLTAFTGLEPERPLPAITVKDGGTVTFESLQTTREKQASKVEELRTRLCGMHKEIFEKSSRKRVLAVASHNRETGVRPINFTERDLFLRGLLQREHGRKPCLRWKGP